MAAQWQDLSDDQKANFGNDKKAFKASKKEVKATGGDPSKVMQMERVYDGGNWDGSNSGAQEAVERATSYQAPADIADYDLTAAGAGSSKGTNRISGKDIRNMQDSGNYSDAEIVSFAEGAMAGGSKYGQNTVNKLNNIKANMTSGSSTPPPPPPPAAATPEAPPTSGQPEESRFAPIEQGPVTQIAGGDDDSGSPSFFRTPEESTANRQEALERGGSYINANQQSNLEVNANYNTPVTNQISGNNNSVENSIDNSMQVNAGSQTMGNTQYSPLDNTRGEFDRPTPTKPRPKKLPEPSTPFKLYEGEGVPDWVTRPSAGDMVQQVMTPITNPETGETYMGSSGGYSLNEDYFKNTTSGPQQSEPSVTNAVNDMRAAGGTTRSAFDQLRSVAGLEPSTDEQWSTHLSEQNKSKRFGEYKAGGGELGMDDWAETQMREANPMMGRSQTLDMNTMQPIGRGGYGEIDPFAPTEDQLNFGQGSQPDLSIGTGHMTPVPPQNAQDYKDNYTQEVSSDFRDSLPDFGDQRGGGELTYKLPTSFIPPREESGTLDRSPSFERFPESAPQPPKSSVIDSNQQKNEEFNMNYNTPINNQVNGNNNVLKNTIDNSFRYYGGDQRSFNYQGSGNAATDTPVSSATMMGYYDADNSPAASASFVDRYTTMNSDNQKDYKNLSYADEAIANRENQSNINLANLEYSLTSSPQRFRDRANVGRYNLLGNLGGIAPPNWSSPVFSQPDEAFDPDTYLDKSLYK